MNTLAAVLKRGITTTMGYGLYYSGLLTLVEHMGRYQEQARAVILYYHRVTNDPDCLSGMGVRPELFRQHMDYIHQSSYTPVSLKTWRAYLQGKETLDGNHVIVTFDDGYRDNYTIAYPILREYDIPATIFLATDPLDQQRPPWWDRLAWAARQFKAQGAIPNEVVESAPPQVLALLRIIVAASPGWTMDGLLRLISLAKQMGYEERKKLLTLLENSIPASPPGDIMLTWDMVREMHAHHIDFGAHTVTHPLLSELDAVTARTELCMGKARIEEELKERVRIFAYPDGNTKFHPQDENPCLPVDQTAVLLQECGFNMAVTCHNGLNTPSTPPLFQKRCGIVNVPLPVLALRMSGLADSAPALKLRRMLGMQVR